MKLAGCTCIYEIMVLYYLCSKNNSDDQPCGNCAADLCLGFHIKSRFSQNLLWLYSSDCDGLAGNPEGRFSYDSAHDSCILQ